MMGEAWIIDAVRTPRGSGRPGKATFEKVHPQRLLSTVLKALEHRTGLNPQDVDDVIAGCNYQVKKQAQCVARMAALDAGWDFASGVSLDRFCGSGLTAVHLGAASVAAGCENLVVAGGVEMMSYKLAQEPLLPLDGGNTALRRRHPQLKVGLCADLIATEEGFTREDLDQIALESQRRAARALEQGFFERSLVPVATEDGEVLLENEEYPRADTTLEKLATLPPAFSRQMDMEVEPGSGETYGELVAQRWPGLKVKHYHHAGNSAGVVDGSAAVLLASPDYAVSQGWRPRGRIRAMVNVAGSPEYMLNEPVPAARKALRRAGMTLSDIDLFEVNEAFAVVPAKFMRDLDLTPELVNVNGGAIALGHPIGATGAILVGTVLDELERRDLKVGLVTMCASGGMAPAMIVERV